MDSSCHTARGDRGATDADGDGGNVTSPQPRSSSLLSGVACHVKARPRPAALTFTMNIWNCSCYSAASPPVDAQPAHIPSGPRTEHSARVSALNAPAGQLIQVVLRYGRHVRELVLVALPHVEVIWQNRCSMAPARSGPREPVPPTYERMRQRNAPKPLSVRRDGTAGSIPSSAGDGTKSDWHVTSTDTAQTLTESGSTLTAVGLYLHDVLAVLALANARRCAGAHWKRLHITTETHLRLASQRNEGLQPRCRGEVPCRGSRRQTWRPR